MAKERLVWADSLKGILILLVVLGHAIQGVFTENVESNRLWNVIYSFHMPAFFAISGYFVRPTGGGYKWLTKRIWQLLVPYFVWAVLKLVITRNFTLASVIAIVTEPVSFWFLWVLFWVYLIFQLSLYLHQKSKAQFNYISVIFALGLIGIMAVFSTKLFAFHLIAYYFAFYALGYYMGQANLLKVTSRWFLGVLALLWLFLAMGWSMHSLPSWVPAIPYVPVVMVQLSYRFLTAFVAIIVLLNISPRILSSGWRTNSVVAKLGFYSLGVYVTHYLIIWWIAEIICKYIDNIFIEVSLSFVIALVFSIVLVWLLNKSRLTAKVFLGKI